MNDYSLQSKLVDGNIGQGKLNRSIMQKLQEMRNAKQSRNSGIQKPGSISLLASRTQEKYEPTFDGFAVKHL